MHRENLSVGSIAGKAEVYLGLVTVPCLAALVVRGTFSTGRCPQTTKGPLRSLPRGDDSHPPTVSASSSSTESRIRLHLTTCVLAIICSPHKSNHSYRTGVKHNSDASTEGFGRQVVVEFCSDDTAVSVRPGHFSPDHADFAALSFTRGFVDECDALAEVEPVTGRRKLVGV